jgi:hypothetical protein
VGVIRQGTICGDHLGRDAPACEVCRLGYAGEFRFGRHYNLPFGCAAVRFGVIECPKAAVSVSRDSARRFLFVLSAPKSTEVVPQAPEMTL